MLGKTDVRWLYCSLPVQYLMGGVLTCSNKGSNCKSAKNCSGTSGLELSENGQCRLEVQSKICLCTIEWHQNYVLVCRDKKIDM